MRRPLAAALLVAYVAVLLWMTLGGFYQPRAPHNYVPFRTIDLDFRRGGVPFVVNILGNLVVFVPMGVLVPVLSGGRRPLARTLLASFGLSLAIEVLQGLSGRRVADVDDVMMNTLSGAIGYGLWRIRPPLGSRRCAIRAFGETPSRIGLRPRTTSEGTTRDSKGRIMEGSNDRAGPDPAPRKFLAGTRSLMIAIVLVALGLGWFTHVYRQAERRTRLLVELSRLGTHSRFDEPTITAQLVKKFWPHRESWFRGMIGKGWFDRPSIFVAIQLRDDPASEVAARLRELGTVREVHYHGPHLTEAGIAGLRAGLPGVNVVPNDKPASHRYFLATMGTHAMYGPLYVLSGVVIAGLTCLGLATRWLIRRVRSAARLYAGSQRRVA